MHSISSSSRSAHASRALSHPSSRTSSHTSSLPAFIGAALLVALSACTCAQPKAPLPGKPKGSACTGAADCQGDLVCNPSTKKCDAVSGCTSDADCGAGAVCDATTKACKDNVPGGPCSSDASCVNGETCRGDTCHPQGDAGSACTSTEQCAVPLVCDPALQKCAASVSCTGNADCGTAAFCSNGSCAPAGNETPCSSDANCSSGDKCLGVVCVPGQCQGEAFQAQIVKPNMMIVLDRSGSMTDNLNNNDGKKIDVAKAAITALVQAHDADIRFGIAPYPGSEQQCDESQTCQQGMIGVDIADNNAQNIVDFLNGMSTCHGTPTGDQIHLMDSYAPLQDTARPDFILLMTDGAADCGADTPTEIGNLLGGQGGQFPPVKTFVIGFGSGVDANQLTAMSNAGGEALSGDPNYFQADSASSLSSIFSSIAQAVLGCDYTLTAGLDPASLLVFFNGVPVPRDATHVTGWDYDPTSALLQFSGNACVALQSGSVNDLSIAFGCPAGGEGEGEGGGEGEGAGGEGEGQSNCGGVGATCAQDSDCCQGFLCDVQTQQCLFLGG